MSRQTIELSSIADVSEVDFPGPVRLVFRRPDKGGPSVGEIRRTLQAKGRLRFQATAFRVFVDFDPGDPEPVLIALDMIARSDARGLERAIQSALPYVDEIVIGIDARSDDETAFVAAQYADVTWRFDAQALGLSDEDWTANKIDFSAARNLGRARLHAPWALVIDTDEYLTTPYDFRTLVSDVGPIGSIGVEVRVGSGLHRDYQRLARAEYRWFKATHNQLAFNAPTLVGHTIVITQDLSLRTAAEIERRSAQREVGVEELRTEAEKGEITALFHLAKHVAGVGDVAEAVRLVEDYRLRLSPHCPLSNERAWLAMVLAFRLYQDENDLRRSEMWAMRALLDGPRVAAFCLLGDIAEDEEDLPRALRWYQAACAIEDDGGMVWPVFTELRQGRLIGIESALALAKRDREATSEKLQTEEKSA